MRGDGRSEERILVTAQRCAGGDGRGGCLLGYRSTRRERAFEHGGMVAEKRGEMQEASRELAHAGNEMRSS